MEITTIGIDLAKSVFQVHAVDQHGKVALKKQLKRGQMSEFFASLPTCLIGREACGSAHYWARKLQAFGHTVKLMAPQFVKPYVKGIPVLRTNRIPVRAARSSMRGRPLFGDGLWVGR